MNNVDVDSGDDFNILDFAEGPDVDGAKGINILDDIEDKDTKKGGKDETKSPPHIGDKKSRLEKLNQERSMSLRFSRTNSGNIQNVPKADSPNLRSDR